MSLLVSLLALKIGHRLYVLYCSLIAFSLIGSVASIAFGLDPGPIAPAAGFLLTMSGAACIAVELAAWRSVAILLVVATAAELAGVTTGYPFGRYEYTTAWWPTLPLGPRHYFPVLLPFAWLLIVGGSYLAVVPFVRRWSAVGCAALLATLVDAPMERAMVDVFGYWRWFDRGPVFGAPLINTAGWFAVSLAATTVLAMGSPKSSTGLGTRVLALFGAFVALSGFLRFLDLAWVLLLAIAGLLWWMAGRKASTKAAMPAS